MTDEGKPYAGSAVSHGRIVPLISSHVTGTLGLMHLPRLWLKALLHSLDLLAEDWGCGPGGLDRRITDAVGIDRDAFVPWLLQAFPTYDECEGWVRAHARNLTAEAIGASNATLATNPLPRGLGAQFRRYLQIDDDSVDVGIVLNDLDDWMAVHRYVTEYRDALEPIVPAIGPAITGPLGIVGLPRLWLKTILGVVGALPADYAFTGEAADRDVPLALGIDPTKATRFLTTTFPTYVQFERWVGQRAGRLEADRAAAVNAVLSHDAILAAEAYDRELLHRTLAARRGREPVNVAGITAFHRG